MEVCVSPRKTLWTSCVTRCANQFPTHSALFSSHRANLNSITCCACEAITLSFHFDLFEHINRFSRWNSFMKLTSAINLYCKAIRSLSAGRRKTNEAENKLNKNELLSQGISFMMQHNIKCIAGKQRNSTWWMLVLSLVGRSF